MHSLKGALWNFFVVLEAGRAGLIQYVYQQNDHRPVEEVRLFVSCNHTVRFQQNPTHWTCNCSLHQLFSIWGWYTFDNESIKITRIRILHAPVYQLKMSIEIQEKK